MSFAQYIASLLFRTFSSPSQRQPFVLPNLMLTVGTFKFPWTTRLLNLLLSSSRVVSHTPSYCAPLSLAQPKTSALNPARIPVQVLPPLMPTRLPTRQALLPTPSPVIPRLLLPVVSWAALVPRRGPPPFPLSLLATPDIPLTFGSASAVALIARHPSAPPVRRRTLA